VSAGGTFSPKNGRVVASLSRRPAVGGLVQLPNGQLLVLASVPNAWTFVNI
jgi:hypothetical protein